MPSAPGAFFVSLLVDETRIGKVGLKKVISVEIKQLIREALTALPQRQHEVVSLRLLRGHSFKEIARLLDMKGGKAD